MRRVIDAESIEVRLIMSTAPSFAVAVAARYDRALGPLAGLSARLRTKFYRFLHELPERYEPVDPEVFKRVPVPI